MSSNAMADVGLVIPAAGRGERLGATDGKALVPLCGRPLLAWTLLAFDAFHEIGERVVVTPPGKEALFRERLAAIPLERDVEYVPGGEERQDSVRAGLRALTAKCRWVLVHDGARPLIHGALVRRVLDVLRSGEAVIPALTPRESVARTGFESWVKSYEDRSKLLLVQTPQGFHLPVLEYAFAKADGDRFHATDEASLVLRANHPVSWIEGDPENVKVTYPQDLVFAEAILTRRNAVPPT
jgi:2-C-methyl-D-erythritol 4-phosphate cytidylyltransferase